MKKLRAFLESIAFAGMKPGGPAAAKPRLWWLGPLAGPVDRLLSGGAQPSDPLYLSNRTSSQKLKSWGLIAVPCLVVALGLGVLLYKILYPPIDRPASQPSAAEITAKLPPNVANTVQFAPPSGVQVVEIKVDGNHLTGIVQNTTTHQIAAADLVIELMNAEGSQIGAVNGVVEQIPASSRKEFQIPIKQRDAVIAMIREISAR